MVGIRFLAGAGLSVLLCAAMETPALAQSRAGDVPSVVGRLLDCRKLTDEHGRLACYDSASDAVAASLNHGDIVAVDRDQIKEVKREAFGFTLPTLNLFERGEKAAVETLSATVATAHQRGDGAWVLEFENGAVWMQTDSTALSRFPKKGSRVEIRRGAIGGFFINLDGQRAIRAKRIQ